MSSATSTQVPQTTKGTFNPVIVFGLGIQIGVGRYFEVGPLKAGFSITIAGLIEGIIAAWHPYSSTAITSGSSVQEDYYFWLRGTFGIIGKLYGTVDFVIIKADVQLVVKFVVQITYESFRAIPITASASVSVKVSVKINLGLFSISISFSFSTTITADVTIGSDALAPWDDDALAARRIQRACRLAPLPLNLVALQQYQLYFKPLNRTEADKPTLSLHPAPQFSILVGL
ncbi:MAG: hypothetical protein AB4062_20780 [Crocosphaera sp.]